MPKSMQYPSLADVYLPFAPAAEQLSDRKAHNYLVTGRLRDGVTVKQAQAEMKTIAEHMAEAYPATNADSPFTWRRCSKESTDRIRRSTTRCSWAPRCLCCS